MATGAAMTGRPVNIKSAGDELDPELAQLAAASLSTKEAPNTLLIYGDPSMVGTGCNLP